ncbi:uncharacterized protein LOC119281378 [Triticum dicoccoides]|uniref:uncharacterized protein LOC119281378 n=1 Tax=Triticum dicoccoides TaxID=85692 RepID=UPI001890B32B|nr:uncharacterized protein LOC119281378 [Triticum dicoccoides]
MLSEMYQSTRRLQGRTGCCGMMAHRLLRDTQADGWERSDFPIIYESCLGDNPYVRMIWYSNVPHTKLVEYKGYQNWVNVSGEHLVFPGGGTQFKHGALHYIDFIQETMV